MKRRDFVKLCAGTIALVYAKPQLLAANNSDIKLYNRVLLTTADGKPLSASSLKPEESYIFNYPYVSTPCLLLNLGKPVKAKTLSSGSGKSPAAISWPGGVGKQESVLAFSAICTHQFSYPTKQISFIAYDANKSKVANRERTIVCCAHQTVFDPEQGAAAISGPTKIPLTTIVLEYDKSKDHIYAVGSLGKEVYDEFFRSFKRDLIEQYGRGKSKQQAESKVVVMRQSEYSKQVTLC